ncbi:MAG: glycosyl hydrolase [Candidatus Aminicenantales bacterium]
MADLKSHRRSPEAWLLVVVVSLSLSAGAGQAASVTAQSKSVDPASGPPRIGLNFIRFFWSESRDGRLNTTTPYFQPDSIFRDFADLGVQAFRQFVRADLLWNAVEPNPGRWNWEAADAVIKTTTFEPIVTLFSMQYASPTPPWARRPEEFQRTLGPEALDYLETVVRRYAPYVKYWEIGNEMDHWRISDPNDKGPAGARAGAVPAAKPARAGLPPRSGQLQQGGQNIREQMAERLPDAFPDSQYTPQEQGRFLAQAAAIIRKNDPDAVIVLPGVSAPDEYCAETWLRGVIEGGGKDWFDIVNYHYYPSWERYSFMREQFAASLKRMGLDGKPVWLTETGATSSATLTLRTNYPNSATSQAADVFRRIVQAFGHGDAFVAWHTYIGSSETAGNWRAYGIRAATGEAKPALAAFRLLTHELIPFARVEKISADARGVNAYKAVLKDGGVKYVVWGQGSFKVPAGVTQMTAAAPDAAGNFEWKPAVSQASLTLSSIPTLLK